MYVSLQDLYSGNVLGRSVQPLPRQLVMLTEQAEILEPGKVYRWIDFNLQNPTELFNKVDGGMGRGEYSLACILWGVNSYEQLKQLEQQKAQETGKPFHIVQGGTVSFDVLGPNGERYEVKQLEIKEGDKKSKGTVRTGANGKLAAKTVIDTVNSFLDDILNAYSTMDDESKTAINSAILNSQVVRDTILSNKLQAKRFQERTNTWTLEKYLNEIKRKSNVELSQNLLLGDVIELGRYTERPDIIFSLKQLVDVLEEVTSTTSTLGSNPSIKDLYDTILRNYQISSDDPKEREFFEKEAKQIDRSITQKQCRLFKKCTNQDSFKQIIKTLNLPQSLAEIRVAMSNVLPITFPETGLLIVSPYNFVYVPKERLNEFIVASQISGGAPKIGLKIPTLQ